MVNFTGSTSANHPSLHRSTSCPDFTKDGLIRSGFALKEVKDLIYHNTKKFKNSSDVPPEVIDEVLKFEDPKNIANTALVSKTFHRYAQARLSAYFLENKNQQPIRKFCAFLRYKESNRELAYQYFDAFKNEAKNFTSDEKRKILFKILTHPNFLKQMLAPVPSFQKHVNEFIKGDIKKILLEFYNDWTKGKSYSSMGVQIIQTGQVETYLDNLGEILSKEELESIKKEILKREVALKVELKEALSSPYNIFGHPDSYEKSIKFFIDTLIKPACEEGNYENAAKFIFRYGSSEPCTTNNLAHFAIDKVALEHQKPLREAYFKYEYPN